MRSRITPSLLAAAVTLAPLTVWGQEGGLEEIVVTAQKRTEHAVDVPISMTVVSGDGLEASGVSDMASLSQLVPGLHIDSSGAFFQPSIRGVGTAIAGAGASANVATYVDDIYKPNALSNDFDFIDVESVQVLKGPQGTLFGRNATGGAILVTTKTPSFEPGLEIRAGYGSFNTFNGAFFGTMGLSDRVAASLAVGYSESDGWTDNVFTGKDAAPSENTTARLKLLFQLSDDWKATFAADYNKFDDPSLYAVNAYKGYSNAAAFFGVPMITNKSRKVSLNEDIVHEGDGYGFDLKLEGDLGFATFTSLSNYHDDDGSEATIQTASIFPPNGTTPVAPFPNYLFPLTASFGQFGFVGAASWDYTQEVYSQEFRLSHSEDGVLSNWVTGLFYFHEETEYKPFNISLYGPFGPGGAFEGALPPWPASSYVYTGYIHNSTFSAKNRSIAAYADATFDLGKLTPSLEKWSFTAGGRYAKDRPGVSYKQFFGVPAPVDLGSDKKTFSSFTPRAVLHYAINDDSNVYLSWSKGYKAGLFNASGYAADQEAVDPEKISAFELGYKIARSRWRFEAAAFHYDYTDLQVATYVGTSAIFQNADKAKIYGADMHWEQLVTDSFTVDLGLAYTHAEYDNFPEATVQTFDPAQGGVVNGVGDVSGERMQRTPKYSGSLGLTYSLALLEGKLDLNAVYSYQDDTTFDFAGTLTEDSVGLLNLRAAWTDPSNKWTLAVSGRNVTDEKYLVQVLPNAGGFGQAWGAPASVMAEVGYKF
ncbi:MAG: TonB-dependent receptor [Steroidobacteraceae bacterium]